MQKDQVEVGRVTQLDAAELAVADDGETIFHRLQTAGPPVLFHQIPPDAGLDTLQRYLGDLRQQITDHHQRYRTDDVGRRDAQPIALRELAQALHLLFEIIVSQGRQQAVQLGLEFAAA